LSIRDCSGAAVSSRPASATGRGVARGLVLDVERDAQLAGLDRRLTQPVVDRGAVGRLVVEPPEIEDADVGRVKRVRQRRRPFDQLVLLGIGEIGAELRAARTETRLRRTGQSTLKIGDASSETRKSYRFRMALRLGHLARIPAHDVLVVRRPQLDVTEAELARRDFARAPQVLVISSVSTRTVNALLRARGNGSRAATRAPKVATKRRREVMSGFSGARIVLPCGVGKRHLRSATHLGAALTGVIHAHHRACKAVSHEERSPGSHPRPGDRAAQSASRRTASICRPKASKLIGT